MTARAKSKPPRRGYIVANPDGLFGMYRTLDEARSECSLPSDRVWRYVRDEVQPPVPAPAKRGK